MIVKHIDDLNGTDREVKAPTWTSRRLLLKSDGMGFSFHETVLPAGTETPMQYTNHVESVYCVGGKGKLHDLTNDVTYDIRPGTMYALNHHEKHILVAEEELRMLCVFNPPVTGAETHDENGSYPLVSDAA